MIFNFTFEGNIASQPELRFSQNGVPVCNLVVMRTARFRRNGEWVDGQTVALNVSCWRDLGERAADLNKGDTVIVEVGDDLHGESFNGRAYLRATARTLAVSMRWHGATSHRQPRTDQEATVEVAPTGGYDTAAADGYDAETGEVTDETATASVETAPAAATKTARTRKPSLSVARRR